MIYMPDYYCATKQGFVAEHRYNAEQKIGRHLKPGEIVHHVDHCRTNNDPNNLLVFRTREDHSRFHRGGKLVEMEDGTYISYFEKPDIYCEYCGKKFEPSSNTTKFCSQSCRQKATRVVQDRPNRTQLKKLILEHSMVDIAKMYNISDNGVRRWCENYHLPYRVKDIKKLREKELKRAEEKKLKS